MKPYSWHIAYLVAVPVATLSVLLLVGGRVPDPEPLPDYQCRAVHVPVAEHRVLAVRYGIPVSQSAPYRLVLVPHRAFGKLGWRAQLNMVSPARTEIGYIVSTIRDTCTYETPEEAMREASGWWAGCR